MATNENPVLICLVAGMSSRFGGALKQLARVGPSNETLIEYSINQALINRYTRIIFVTNAHTEHKFRELFGDSYKNTAVTYVRQSLAGRDCPWGTLDAICCALPYVTSTFMVINGDDLYGVLAYRRGLAMVLRGANYFGLVDVLKTLTDNTPANRGIVRTHGSKIIGMREYLGITRQTARAGQLCSVNFFGGQRPVLVQLREYVEDFKHTHEGERKLEILLPDVINQVLHNISFEYFIIQEPVHGLTYPSDVSRLRIILRDL